LLAQAAILCDNEFRAQEILRADFPAELCRAAVGLAQLRREARDKFALADRMFFDREGLEMASRQEIARYRAWRLRHCNAILDLCCGIGGDLLALGAQAQVCAVDLDRVRLEMARMNAAAAGLEAVDFIQADARFIKPRGDAVFLDPARRSKGRRVRAAEAYSPPLSCIGDLRRSVSAVAVKVAPAIREEDLPPECEVEFISAAGQCREAVLYFGELATTRRRATILPGRHTLEDSSGEAVPIAPPGAYLYDPDPAVVRSHLLDPLCRHLDAWKLDPQVAYLSSDTCTSTPFARAYQVLTCQPFHLKRLRQLLQGEGFFPNEIKKRRFPMDSQELQQLLKVRSGGQPVTLIATRIHDQPVVAICKKVGN
jgi:SAM-dependent methyltransferase